MTYNTHPDHCSCSPHCSDTPSDMPYNLSHLLSSNSSHSPLTCCSMSPCCCMHCCCWLFFLRYHSYSSMVSDIHNNCCMMSPSCCQPRWSIHCPQTDMPYNSCCCYHYCCILHYTLHRSYCHHCRLTYIRPLRSMYYLRFPMQTHCSLSSLTHHYNNYYLYCYMISFHNNCCNWSSRFPSLVSIHCPRSGMMYNWLRCCH